MRLLLGGSKCLQSLVRDTCATPIERLTERVSGPIRVLRGIPTRTAEQLAAIPRAGREALARPLVRGVYARGST